MRIFGSVKRSFTALLFTMTGKKTHQNIRRRAGSNESSAKKFGYDYSKDYKDQSWPYHHGRMDKGAKFLIVAFPTAIIAAIVYVWYSAYLRDLVSTPLNAPLISNEVDHRSVWGSYRSNLYFGFKTRSPNSPVAGLMWMTQFTGEMPPPIRHWCEHGDGLLMYGWFAHDGSNFGVQEILDKYHTFSTDFVKRPGGVNGGDWSARVHVKPRPGAEDVIISLFFYMALDGQGLLEPEFKSNKLIGIKGRSAELGDFYMRFPHSSKAAKLNYLVTWAPGLEQLKESMMKGMRMQTWDKSKKLDYISLGGRSMPTEFQAEPNFIVYQVTVQPPYDFEVNFESASFVERPDSLTGEVYQKEIQNHLSAFDAKFEDVFKLKAKGFTDDKISFAKGALSNMLGSIGYFYGSSLVKSKYNKEPANYWDAPLLSAVPSRSFFPRGFLWDEGFHNLLLSKWDSRLSMDIIGHWLDLMNIEGWIPREQILGMEARAKVPSEFVVQHNENANPPTLFLPLQKIVQELISSNTEHDRIYLQHLYPRLKAWYNWFNTTQAGSQVGTYHWRGRDANSVKELNPKTLTSGLDDYPRASHPTDQERHLDLRCWMTLASKVMADIGKSLNESWQEYDATYRMLTDNALLDSLHWSEAAQRYSDYGLHTDQVKLEKPKPKPTPPGQRPNPQPQEKIRVVKKEPENRLVDSHFGYNSLFPFLLKIIEPNSLKLGRILSDLQDPNLLWTKFGLRSLARNSPLYKKHNTEHDPPYWRGAIWININYLALGALDHYSNVPGPYQENALSVYKELRSNIIDNMLNQYKNTGYIWEQYDDNTGTGKGTHPFTGWSALIVNIMAEQY